MIVVEGRARAAIFSCRSPCCASGTRRGAATSTAPGSVESSRGVAGSTRSPRAAPRPGRCARGGGVLAVAVCAVLAVLGPAQVRTKSNYNRACRRLLNCVERTMLMVISDAMHIQREHAAWMVGAKNAAYICSVKLNKPNLYRQLKALPWRYVPVQ